VRKGHDEYEAKRAEALAMKSNAAEKRSQLVSTLGKLASMRSVVDQEQMKILEATNDMADPTPNPNLNPNPNPNPNSNPNPTPTPTPNPNWRRHIT
jgi:hypothetical protein